MRRHTVSPQPWRGTILRPGTHADPLAEGARDDAEEAAEEAAELTDDDLLSRRHGSQPSANMSLAMASILTQL